MKPFRLLPRISYQSRIRSPLCRLSSPRCSILNAMTNLPTTLHCRFLTPSLSGLVNDASISVENGHLRTVAPPSSSSSPTSSSSSSPDAYAAASRADRSVAYWLFGVSALVFGIVVVGGLTRLTRSGLSMVEWRPTQSVPPLTEDEWLIEFNKYKLYPEYQLMNSEMTLNEFKFIFLMEFSHRQLGRLVGIVFGIPFVYFIIRRKVSLLLIKRLSLVFAMGATQGAIGWWMVMSGLVVAHQLKDKDVKVSPYRLATHLLTAFAIYALLLSSALHIYAPHTPALIQTFNSNQGIRRLRLMSRVTAALIATTIASGAFVAGNHAGTIYNEWPLMGGYLIPTDLIDIHLKPFVKNFFEHTTLVQFDHRILAYASVITTTGIFLFARRLPLTPAARTASVAMFTTAWLQASLGITTLLTHVAIPVASLHQAGAVTLLTVTTIFLHTLGGPKAKLFALKQYVTPIIQASAPLSTSNMRRAAVAAFMLPLTPSTLTLIKQRQEDNSFACKKLSPIE